MSRRDYRLQAGVKPLQVNDKQSSAEGATHATTLVILTKEESQRGLVAEFDKHCPPSGYALTNRLNA